MFKTFTEAVFKSEVLINLKEVAFIRPSSDPERCFVQLSSGVGYNLEYPYEELKAILLGMVD